MILLTILDIKHINDLDHSPIFSMLDYITV